MPSPKYNICKYFLLVILLSFLFLFFLSFEIFKEISTIEIYQACWDKFEQSLKTNFQTRLNKTILSHYWNNLSSHPQSKVFCTNFLEEILGHFWFVTKNQVQKPFFSFCSASSWPILNNLCTDYHRCDYMCCPQHFGLFCALSHLLWIVFFYTLADLLSLQGSTISNF